MDVLERPAPAVDERIYGLRSLQDVLTQKDEVHDQTRSLRTADHDTASRPLLGRAPQIRLIETCRLHLTAGEGGGRVLRAHVLEVYVCDAKSIPVEQIEQDEMGGKAGFG